jgi:hypothetical protein
MVRMLSSPRRRAFLVTFLVVAAGSVSALWLLANREPVPLPDARPSALEHVRGRAAATEALFVLASLRSAIDAEASPVANGAHARRTARQLDATFPRAVHWAAFDDDVSALRDLVQADDLAARTRAAELERGLLGALR